ncbi:hypothetical protein IAU59_002256 [Kwoniella sp. CBS 9459]
MLTCIPPHLREEVSRDRLDSAPKTISYKSRKSRIGICGEGRGQRSLRELSDMKPDRQHATESTKIEDAGPHTTVVATIGYAMKEKQVQGDHYAVSMPAPHQVQSLSEKHQTGSTSTATSDILNQTYVDHCQALLLSPPEGTHTDRLQAIGNVLEQGAVYITEPGPSAQYYLGAFSREDWSLSERPFLIVIPSSSPTYSSSIESISDAEAEESDIILLTPAFEALRASLIRLPDEIKSRVKWLQWREDQSPYVVLADYLTSKGLNTFVLDGGVRQFVGSGLAGVLHEVVEGDVVGEVGKIRERKSGYEIEMLRCANTFTIHAIRQVKKRMHIGITESQTAEIMEEELAKTGLIGGEGLVLFGENAALPHGSGTDRKLGKEDMILIDAGGKWGGYVSDITRTFALPSSKIPQSHIDLWEAVRKAQLAPRVLLNSPTRDPATLKFADLDAGARAIVSLWKAGIPIDTPSIPDPVQEATQVELEYDPDFSIFTHRLGHGIGLEGHESPYLVQGPQGDRTPQVGNVFSLEPGIYLPADGEEVRGLRGIGVRLEDCFVITGQEENGAWKGEWLSGPVEKWGDI